MSKLYEETEVTVTAEHPGISISGRQLAQSSAIKIKGNSYKRAIKPVACWKIEDICFDFDGTFVKKDSIPAFIALRKLHKLLKLKFARKYRANPLFSLFGHADPIGDDVYNKKLSENRAKAVYGILTRNSTTWKDIFNTNEKVQHLQTKLKNAGHDPGAINGVMSQQTEDAIITYMEELSSNFIMSDSDFIENGQFAYQGCSRFNPVLMFSSEEWDFYKKRGNSTLRDNDNQPNRRVVGFFFKPGTIVKHGLWPCGMHPDVQSCYNEFLDDPQTRRSYQKSNRREHGKTNIDASGKPVKEKTKETFICDFYTRIASLSPCEFVRQFIPFIRILFSRTTHEFLILFKYDFTGIEWTDASGHSHHTPDLSFFSVYARKLENFEIIHASFVHPSNPTHEVKTHITIFNKAGETWYRFNADVVDTNTNKKLSEGMVEAKHLYDIGGTWVLTGGRKSRKIWRKLSAVKGENFRDPRTGNLVPAEMLPRKDRLSEPGILEKMDDLYKILCKGYPNIIDMIRNET